MVYHQRNVYKATAILLRNDKKLFKNGTNESARQLRATMRASKVKQGVAARQPRHEPTRKRCGRFLERSPTSRPALPQTRSCRYPFERESFLRTEHPFSPVSTRQHPSQTPTVKARRRTQASRRDQARAVQLCCLRMRSHHERETARRSWALWIEETMPSANRLRRGAR